MKTLLKVTLQISEEDRLQLANKLMQTLPDEEATSDDMFLRSWNVSEELERRDAGYADAIPWKDVRDMP